MRYTPAFARTFGLGQRVNARSYSTPRKILMTFALPDAYYEWGAPSKFEADEEPNDDHGDGPGRKRYTFSEEARYFKLSIADTEVNDNFTHSQGFYERTIHSFAMNGPDGVQHRFYVGAEPQGFAKFRGYSPVIPVPAAQASWSNRYNFVPFEDAS